MKKVVIALFIAFVASTIFICGFINTNSLPVSSDQTIQQFVINQGEGLQQISSRLVKNNLIRNDLVFLLLAHKMGLNNKLQAGLFKLSPSLSTREVILKLSKSGNYDY